MPIYEFACNKCANEFELLVFGKKDIKCPECETGDVRRKMSLFGVSGAEKQVSSGGNCGGCSKSSCSTC